MPDELQGEWEAEIVPRVGGGLDPISTLTLTDAEYRVVRSPASATGDVTVEGDDIAFSGGGMCSGTGRYHWELEDGALSFAVISEPCPGRETVLDGQTYRR